MVPHHNISLIALSVTAYIKQHTTLYYPKTILKLTNHNIPITHYPKSLVHFITSGILCVHFLLYSFTTLFTTLCYYTFTTPLLHLYYTFSYTFVCFWLHFYYTFYYTFVHFLIALVDYTFTILLTISWCTFWLHIWPHFAPTLPIQNA